MMNVHTNPKLYFVTPEIGPDPIRWQELILNAVEGGVGMVQIRAKKSSKQRIFHAANQLQPFLKKANIPLIINDHIDVALALQADGVHLGQTDTSVEKARKMLGKKMIIGLSVETMEQVADAHSLDIHYLAASPVFSTMSKNDCTIPWGITGLKKIRSMTHHPLFAIGGIHLHNIESVLECGVNGIAVISAISQAPCPKEAAQAISQKMRNHV